MGSVAKVIEFPEVKRFKPETADALIALYKRFSEAHDMPAWMKEIGFSALTTLETQGLPTPKLERWKYTNLSSSIKSLKLNEIAVSDISFEPVDSIVQKLGEAIETEPQWLVDILGAEAVGADKYDDMALWALSNVFLRDGIVVDVLAGKAVDKPVDISVNGHDGGFTVPRTVIRLGEGAELTVIERQQGTGMYWQNGLTQIIVGKNAKLRHYRIQDHADEAVYTQNTHVQIERDGNYEAFTLTTGAGLSRNQIHAELLGENANCDFYGVNLLNSKETGDTTITIEHKAPHCTSNQFYRHVLDGQAKGIFQGKVHVHRIAQKTDGYQLSNTLMLSESAEMDTKPELEIYADDVKCSHGATTGQLDDEQLFYLRSRGLPLKQAKGLMIESFVGEVVDKIGNSAFQEEISEICKEWLADALL